MLVLARHKNETITIRHNGKDIATITVCDLRRNKVCLGLDGPQETEFIRTELLDGHEWEPRKPATEKPNPEGWKPLSSKDVNTTPKTDLKT